MKTASPFSRAAAFLLDSLLILGWAAVLALISIFFLPRRLAIFATPLTSDLAAFLLLVLPAILYFTISESSSIRATLGKRRLGIQVVRTDFTRLSFGRAFLRSLLQFLPWQIAHTSLFQIPGWPSNATSFPDVSAVGFSLVWLLVLVYLGMMVFSRQHRTPYDWIAGSMVVNRIEPEGKI